jgi:hypothetical protein
MTQLIKPPLWSVKGTRKIQLNPFVQAPEAETAVAGSCDQEGQGGGHGSHRRAVRRDDVQEI